MKLMLLVSASRKPQFGEVFRRVFGYPAESVRDCSRECSPTGMRPATHWAGCGPIRSGERDRWVQESLSAIDCIYFLVDPQDRLVSTNVPDIPINRPFQWSDALNAMSLREISEPESI